MKSMVSSTLFCCVALSVTTAAYAQAISKPLNSTRNLAITKTITTLPDRQAKIYFGSEDPGGFPIGWQELADPNNYSKWNYVRTHANGFYTNFATMDHMFANGTGPAAMATSMANAFTHKDAFYETDMNYPEAQDTRNIACLTSGGFTIRTTSLNYGISAQRVNTLRTYKGTRECLTLMGPWGVGGDILGNTPGNSDIRANITATDGMSADSPLRPWYNDDQSTREGLYSTIAFTSQLNKTSAVQLAPADSSDRPGFTGPTFLVGTQQMVFDLEDHQTVPSIWGVYPYGALTSYPTFPESVVDSNGDTVAPDTKSGVAYWLIQHFNTLPTVNLLNSGVVKTYADVTQTNPSHAIVYFGKGKNGAAQCTMPFVISNGLAPGIAISPVVRAIISNSDGWKIQFKSGGTDVTDAVVYSGGLNFVGGLRISKTNSSTLQMSIQATRNNLKPVTIQLQTMSNISNTVNKAISFTIIAQAQ